MQIKTFRKITILFFIFTVALVNNVCAQQPITFNAGQYRISIPKFTEGSVADFDNDFVKRGIIPSIKDITAPVEIRLYRWTQGRTKSLLYGRVFVIRLDSGLVKCITYAGRGKLPVDMLEDDDPNKPNVELGNIVDSLQYYKWVTVAQPPITPDSLFNTLIRYKLFELKDEPQHIQSLEAANGSKGVDSTILKCANCFADETLLLEIKIGNKFRNIHVMARDYGEPSAMHQALQPYTRLKSFLYGLMYGERG